MEDRIEKEREYAEEISILRRRGELISAIDKCQEAISFSPEDNFFYKILGDMYFQNGEYEKAGDAYIENLKYIGGKSYLFKTFVKFYRSLESIGDDKAKHTVLDKIKVNIQHHIFPLEIEKSLLSFLVDDFSMDSEYQEIFSLSNDDKNRKSVTSFITDCLENNDTVAFQGFIDYKLKASDHSKCQNIDNDLILQLEKNEKYSEALDLIEQSQFPYNFTNQSRILRICRRMYDYSVADRLLKIDDEFISKSDFNVQYELVFYFQAKNDESRLSNVLKCMRRSASSSIPIAKTLYNFYLTFNKFDEAQETFAHLKRLESQKKNGRVSTIERQTEQAESEQIVWQKLKDLVSEQEHTRQMIALRDLLKGFSHELGQPITNIRYNVQLQKIKLDKGVGSQEEIRQLLDKILDQTGRIGNLLDRFRPIVSSKSEKSQFHIREWIEKVSEDLGSRLKANNIHVNIYGDKELAIFGDPVQFSQVFYNLILNSMQAIEQNGNITIEIKSKAEKVLIIFWDNGPGIPYENQQKIFEPFFSTKDPTSGNGGEGLGLFIVWNILKMFDGEIQLDSKYTKGAKFIIKLAIPKEEVL